MPSLGNEPTMVVVPINTCWSEEAAREHAGQVRAKALRGAPSVKGDTAGLVWLSGAVLACLSQLTCPSLMPYCYPLDFLGFSFSQALVMAS